MTRSIIYNSLGMVAQINAGEKEDDLISEWIKAVFVEQPPALSEPAKDNESWI